MIAVETLYSIRCDSCNAAHESYDYEEVSLFSTAAAARRAAEDLGADPESDWTTDGEKLHCPRCEPLKLSQAALDEIARRPGPNDVPLIGLEAL